MKGIGATARIAVEDFDLEATLHSGQVFHWEPHGEGGFIGTVGSIPLWLAQPERDALEVTAGGEAVAKAYLGLGDDMREIWGSFPGEDETLRRAVAFSPGLRIVRQPAWECLATFITSSLKQVAHIRQISLALRRRFGERHLLRGRDVHEYPAPETLAAAGETALRECGMGYRAKSLHRAALRLAQGEASLEDLAGLESNAELHEALCRFHGVGDKIANCVMLFGFGRLNSFPVDVWMSRVLRRNYSAVAGEKTTPSRVQEFADDHFGPYGGYAQQYLFHHARCGREPKGSDGRVEGRV